jgi:hypothetical protein
LSPLKIKKTGAESERVMARYSSQRKAAILNKLLPPSNITVAEVSREEGVIPPKLVEVLSGDFYDTNQGVSHQKIEVY